MTDTAVSRRLEWRNKIIRIIFSFFIAFGAVLNIAPFSVVYADNALNYSTSENGSAIEVTEGEGMITAWASRDANDTVKGFIFRNSDTNSRNNKLVFIADEDSVPSVAVKWGVYQNGFLNYEELRLWYNETYHKYICVKTGVTIENIACPYNVVPNLLRMSNDELLQYVFDNMPSDINYGQIQDLSYSTNIVGSGTTTGDANIDTISWYPYWDTNSNISTNWNMDIQVVPGTWQGGTNTDIFSQTYQNFIINESGAMSIYHGTYLKGSFSISWGEVKNKLSILSWADLFQYFDGTYWNKKGWVYRARFNDPENGYWSEWQTVYTVTSSAGEGVEKYIDPDDGTGLPGFYQDVEDSFNTTSVVNNNTNVTHIYTGIPMTVNIDDTETSEDITKIKKYVKQIRDILINLNTENSTTENNQNDQEITNNLNSVVGDLHITEDEFMTDMDEKLNDIDRNVELLNDNKFIAAANWVRLQYDYLVSDTPFELLIVFGLVLSLALIIIGKIR